MLQDAVILRPTPVVCDIVLVCLAIGAGKLLPGSKRVVDLRVLIPVPNTFCTLLNTLFDRTSDVGSGVLARICTAIGSNRSVGTKCFRGIAAAVPCRLPEPP